MISVLPYTDDDRQLFEQLFGEYYKELDCPDDTAHLIEEYILPDMRANLLKIDIMREDGKCIGFIIYQVDDIDNDWNFKEGWGDVREIYIIPPYRRQGLGRFLLFTAEAKLKEMGAKGAYCLPFCDAEQFFAVCGYNPNDEYCEDLDCPVYVKQTVGENCTGCNKQTT